MRAALNILLSIFLSVIPFLSVHASSESEWDSIKYDVVKKAMAEELTSTSIRMELMATVGRVCANRIGDITAEFLGKRIDKLPSESDLKITMLYKSSMMACHEQAERQLGIQLDALREQGW
ncbi:hypothetical protein [Pseudidiomarina sp. CB1]|uniref:hypothetical protein n=1 Tax=Pseudidiomarina sp. CB1 TaxID=2972484 RepID=UPI002161C8DE|nr:hypothetical protein [Pseudidiomarina sp. CB1]